MEELGGLIYEKTPRGYGSGRKRDIELRLVLAVVDGYRELS
jgi:hypothetical protein